MTPVQVKVYLEKIKFNGIATPTVENLIKIVEGHIFTFPFETIDLHDTTLDNINNRGITYDFDKLFDRAIKHNRGGHCAVLNLLLLKALKAIGFDVIPILPDTLWQIDDTSPPSSHCACIVTIAGEHYLVDAGFGGVGLLSPIPLKVGEYKQYSEEFRIVEGKKHEFEIHILNKNQWECLYGFNNQPSTIQAFSHVNQIQSSPRDPECSFSNVLLCTMPVKIDNAHNGRMRLFNTTFKTYNDDYLETSQRVDSQQKFHKILKEKFGIDLKGHHLRMSTRQQNEFLKA
ncbi:MAG: arylamine N-acetyltransferase, partial [Candidatus Berkiella sp.]